MRGKGKPPERAEFVSAIALWRADGARPTETRIGRLAARTCEPDPEWEKVQDSGMATLEDIVREAGRSFVYEYDLGDCWMHEITVSGPVEAVGDERPRCTGGARACPPEDCGGPYRYQDLLKAISDPRHEEHDELLDWVGDDFDPEAFDARAVVSALGQMR